MRPKEPERNLHAAAVRISKVSHKKYRSPDQQMSDFSGLFNQARQSFAQGSFATAERLLQSAQKLRPEDVAVKNLLAVVLASLHRHEESETLLLEILRTDPDHLWALVNLGRLYQLSGRLDAAESVLRKALSVSPNEPVVHLNLGVVFNARGKHNLALAAYERCIKLQPNLVQAWFNRGVLLEKDFEFSEAQKSYLQTLRLDPGHSEANSNLLLSRHYCSPYSPEQIRDLSFAFGDRLAALPKMSQPHAVDRDPIRRLKIGFVSADLRDHPVGWFLQDVIPAIDSAGVSLHAYVNSPHFDTLSERLQPHFSTWRHVDTVNDNEMAQYIRQDGIDLLVDLSGHTGGNRLQVFARRPAPIQLSWLGYFATTGLREMDYILADEVCAPAHESSLYREQLWCLPHSRLFLFRPTASDARPRESSDFCFASFQTLAKINNEVLALWREILKQVPEARLRIQSRELDDPRSRKRFEDRMRPFLDPSRVELSRPRAYAEYLTGYREVDLVLDTFPFPGGTTTVEALWQGVPTLSLVRPGILGRQGEGLLRAAGLNEWVCTHETDYVARAVHWAQPGQRAALRALRTELPHSLARQPAADPNCFARDLMTAWRTMWQRYCAEGRAQ
jgi:predicted O-linked N-acetylglucosamine transferase (SPINDLY family)